MSTALRNLLSSTILATCFILQSNAVTYYRRRHQLPSAVVVGTALCNTCSQQESSEYSHSIPGALVEVNCAGVGKYKLGFQKQVMTNRQGVFRFRLPFKLSRNVETMMKTCSVKLVRSSNSFCSATSSETSVELWLKWRHHGVRVHSALKQSEACNHDRKVRPAFLFPPPIPFLPPPSIPFLPPPSIPFLPSPPNIGGVPLPPNPLQPPPSLVPPLPFVPSPPPFSIIPPLPFQPPPPPSSIIPPVPGIPPFPSIPPLPIPVASPPPPPPPAFLFPPLPLPPIFPGNPPADSAPGSSK